MSDDERLMRAALEAARAAAADNEVPVGAVVARGDEVLAVASNRREADADPTAHAELLALRAAARRLRTWRLHGCTLVVTLEPCPMCAGAAMQARVDRIVYGCPDPKAGAVDTLYRIASDARLNHRAEIRGGVLADEAAVLLEDFFRSRRERRRGQSK